MGIRARLPIRNGTHSAATATEAAYGASYRVYSPVPLYLLAFAVRMGGLAPRAVSHFCVSGLDVRGMAL